MRIILVVVSMFVALTSFATSVPALASSMPVPTLCSKFSASRWFESANGEGYPLAALQVGAVQYSSPDGASSAISPWFDAIRDNDEGAWDESGLQPVAVETISDETRALVGTVVGREDATDVYEKAVLAVRVDSLFFTFIGWADYSSPLDSVVMVAKRTLGIEPLEFDPVPDIPYRRDALFHVLPRIEHLPDGMTWEEDWSTCSDSTVPPLLQGFATPH